MKKILVFSILLLSAIAVTTGTTITTIQILQPAYSQAQTCANTQISSVCVTQGQNPTVQRCEGDDCFEPSDITHQQASRFIRGCHTGAILGECTVTPP